MALQAVVEDHGGDDGDEAITKLTLKNKRSKRDVKRAQPEGAQGDAHEYDGPKTDETTVATVEPNVSDVEHKEATVPHGPKSGTKTIHRVRSDTVLATITTVIKMEEGGHGNGRHHRRASVDSRIKHGESRSRVSLVPEVDGQLDLSIVAGEDDEYMSAGDGEEDMSASIIEDSDSLREGEHNPKGKGREIVAPASRAVI